MNTEQAQARVLVLHCAESGKKALSRMADSGRKIAGSIVPFELPCTGRINEVMLMETLENGFDGVLVVGCHRDNCRYLDGNLRAERRIDRIRDLLSEAGVPDKAVEMVFISPDEGRKLYESIVDFTNKLKELKERVTS